MQQFQGGLHRDRDHTGGLSNRDTLNFAIAHCHAEAIFGLACHWNQRMFGILERLKDARRTALNPDRIDASHAEHCAIVKALIAGDGLQAAALIEQHMEKGKHLILQRGRA